jgi:hypothetical protein
LGGWYFGDDAVTSDTTGLVSIKVDQGVSLGRIMSFKLTVPGLYRCEIPDAENVLQALYIGVYEAGCEFMSVGG